MKKIAILTLVFAMAFAVTPAFAGTFVFNSNSAIVGNQVSSSANTGSNYAGGADTGNGGSAGDITNNGDGDADDNATGNGGNGGAISGTDSGGTVVTGDATSGAGVVNMVNSNRTSVDNCGCDGGEEGSFTLVKNRNRAIVMNGVGSDANTGDNTAKGADTGNGGSGGDIDNNGQEGDADDNTTGNGGTAGSISGANSGGFIQTGAAVSGSSVVNMVNRNVTCLRN